jgi:cell wall-associated NlpC family hydrolase
MTEQEQRDAVIVEARSWMGTPFRHGARLKGINADCETFLAEVYALTGVFTARDIPYVPSQWFLNGREELYLQYLSRYATEYEFTPGTGQDDPKPGDIICVKHRWVHSHGAIVLEWPHVIHCHPPCVMDSDVFSNPIFRGRELKFFNPWGERSQEIPSL